MTRFGFAEIPAALKTVKIRDLFSRVSNNYDLMNDLMSFGLHRCWKQSFVDKIYFPINSKILDCAAGSGDIAMLLSDTYPYLNPEIYCLDLTEEMLEHARERSLNNGKIFNFINAASEELPFSDNMFDAYSISFALRNVSDIQKSLEEAYRVLKPGGGFYAMDFGPNVSSWLQKPYDLYLQYALPFLGRVIAADKDAYQYLADSIQNFYSPQEITEFLTICGFQDINYYPLNAGIVNIFYGCK